MQCFFLKCLPCTRYHAKHFTCITSFKSFSHTEASIKIPILYQKTEDQQGGEHFPKLHGYVKVNPDASDSTAEVHNHLVMDTQRPFMQVVVRSTTS